MCTWASVEACAPRFPFSNRCDEDGTESNITWHVIFLASGVQSSTVMLVDVVLCLDEVLELGDGGIELQPLLVDGLGDAIGGEAGLLEPAAQGVHGLCGGREDVVDLLGRVVLPVSGRAVVGAEEDCQRESYVMLPERRIEGLTQP